MGNPAPTPPKKILRCARCGRRVQEASDKSITRCATCHELLCNEHFADPNIHKCLATQIEAQPVARG